MKQLIIKTDDQRLKALEEIKNLNAEKLYIWGSGSYSRDIERYLRTVGCYKGPIQFLVDDVYYQGQNDVIPTSEFLQREDVCKPVVFGFYNYRVILKKKAEHPELRHVYDFHLTIVNGKRLAWNAYTAKSREHEYQKIYELLEDEKSRRCMQLYLNAATTGDFHELFTECYEEQAYFNRFTEGLPVDTLIDCGAFNGDSIHDFVSTFHEYKKIIALEPDPSNLEELRDREKKENIRNLSIINKCVGSQSSALHFRANGKSNSFLDEDGDIEVQITTLDEISDECTGNTLVKMDIEGAELDALRGAKKLIQERHPILTVCVYHKEEDLIDIPKFIHETADEGVYKYYLGFHGLDLAELVFYAIPKELK